MKKFILAGIWCIGICAHSDALAQEYKVSVQNPASGTLTLVGFRGTIPIEGYNGKEIVIAVDSAMKAPEKAAGLKPVFPDGVDNTGIGISMIKNENKVTLRYLLPLVHKQQYKIRIPETFNVKIENSCGNTGEITIANLTGEIEIKNCYAVTMNNVTGPVVLSTVTGNIDISFGALRKDKPTALASIGGDIDIKLPSNAGVNLEISTVTGNVYSDFDFPAGTENKDVKQVGGPKISTQLNGGGTDLKITSIRGNIYLRKSR